ncbi:hypothetical protein JXJ21_18070 [candidate division KSB1 bacterium]|nr:hypothetical protein [candidate division KSB1 bacterium]
MKTRLWKAFKKAFLALIRVPGIFLKAVLHFIYPPYCVICDAWTGDDDSIVCSKCWARLENE